MRKHLAVLLIAALSVTVLSGCTSAAIGSSPGTAKDGDEMAIEKATIKFINHLNEGGYEVISTEELKAKVDASENMVLIDTMPADSFDKGRIPGAVNAELPKEGEATPEQLDAFAALLPADKSTPVVVYCGFVACARSHIGATYAVEQGYETVLRHPGGIIAWKDAGYDVEK